MRITLASLVVLFGFAVAPLATQEPGQNRGPNNKMFEHLGLTPDQHEKIKVILDQVQQQNAPLRQQVQQILGGRRYRDLSPEERESLSPEAWGYLLALRRRGSLDADQFERVLDRLTSSGIRPIGIDLAREVAAEIALLGGDRWGTNESGQGERDLAN